MHNMENNANKQMEKYITAAEEKKFKQWRKNGKSGKAKWIWSQIK